MSVLDHPARMRPRPYVVVGVCSASPPGAVTSIVVPDVADDGGVRGPIGADVVLAHSPRRPLPLREASEAAELVAQL
jgi:UDP-N-acetyl-D-mannosaminuronate dehydrogenase